tara:strand:+ start:2106 stop:3026 length:921 start_codon:yes stop_codon:yes gene_type:complete
MHVRRALSLVLLTFFPLASAKPSCTPVWTNSEAVASERPDFLVQGEYRGKTHGLQIVSAEGNKFYSSRYSGGLPAAVWDGSQIEHLWGDLSDTKRWITGYTRIERSNLGKTKPPPGSIILFDGSDTDEWKDGKMQDGVLATGKASKRAFQDFTLHFEFRNPFKANLTLGHPDRGNSGIYIFGCYEFQFLDTFGLNFDKNAWNEAPLETEPDVWCGSFYKFKKPDVDMCFPPLAWQSYDITFQAPRFESGVKAENARISVIQNGVLVHDDIELLGGTGNGGRCLKSPKEPSISKLMEIPTTSAISGS